MGTLCVCRECGSEFSIKPSDLKKGGGKFCSMHCRHRQNREFGWIKQTYWTAKNRCQHKPEYKDVEFRFETYEQLANAMGPRPTAEHTIDRIDSCGHYEPGNVRWATKQEQTENRSITLKHDKATLMRLCEERGLPYSVSYTHLTLPTKRIV